MNEVYVIVNEVSYLEGENLLVEEWDSVWSTQAKAWLRLEQLALENNYCLNHDETIFYVGPYETGPNVEYSEYRIDIWEVK